ncbi:beta-hydroxyacyl-(acyl-carrier-protein) dehydratase, FabA/FabZ [Flammeovirgaceae bacterium 311]|nr:beta-hydroxyacyl-(acyl-carrier-protein) dehydratase, FabA/FabZ [Flammeovirgaceae bacterium 311]
MLKDKLYTLNTLEKTEEGAYKALVLLDSSSPIFNGHFPGQPVLPGVCLLEMVKEILGQIRKKPCRLMSAAHMKFLKVVDPRAEPALLFEISLVESEAELKIVASSYLGDGSVNFKLKANFAC